MLVKEISLNETSSQQIIEYTVCEPETIEYTIDCYPYFLKGVLWGLLFSILFWVSIIGVLIRVF